MEIGTIKQAGQAVVLGHLAQIFHHRFAFGDVREQRGVFGFSRKHHAADFHGERKPGVVSMGSHDFSFTAYIFANVKTHRFGQPFFLFNCDCGNQLSKRSPGNFSFAPAEQLLRRLIPAFDLAVLVKGHNTFCGVVHDRAQTLFPQLNLLLSRVYRAHVIEGAD